MRPTADAVPVITTVAEPVPASGLVLVLHGGQERSREPVTRWRPAYQRMVPFALALRRAGRGHGLAVWLLRYRVRGWNGAAQDPVRDAGWALDQAMSRHPGIPVVLVGHSMGARTALHVAGDPAVVAVCALAAWTAPADPVHQLAGRSLLMAHGDQDRTTDPRSSYRYAARAREVTDRVCRFDVVGDGHAMLRRPRVWSDLVRRFVLGELGMAPADPAIEAAMATGNLRAAVGGLRGQ